MKIGKLDIKKAYYGSKELTTNNAFVGSVPLIDTPPTGWVTFKANQSSTIGLNNLSSYQKLLYSNNKKDWKVFDTSTSINMSTGDEIYVAGILKRDINSSNYTKFSITGDVSISGNIVYLWNYLNPDDDLKSYCGYNLFNSCTGITDASELTLGTSGIKLAVLCYGSMFSGCTSLTTAPKLPAITLTNNCYNSMFYGCSNLTTAPELPATILDYGCYEYMFFNCTSLTEAPELPATTLAERCYINLFKGCTNLNYIKCLAVNGINQNYSTTNWVYGVSSTGTFISNVDSSWPTGINGIPEGWDNSQKEFVGLTFTAQEDNSSIGLNQLSTNQTLEYSTDTVTWNTFNTSANISLNTGDKVYVRGKLSADITDPNYTQFKMSGKIAASGNINSIWDYEDLNAPLKQYCGYNLFRDCTSLIIPPELPATALKNYCYWNMFYGCTSLTASPELPATTLASNCYRGMFSGCTSLTIAPELPATKLVSDCYLGMFRGCSSLTTAPELPATILASDCYGSMFEGCSSLTTAPELSATKLLPYCYTYMFQNCTSLNYIKCLATDISAHLCTYNWVSGVASSGTFIKDPKANWPTGTSGIPKNWTATEGFKGLKFEAIEDSEFSWTCNVSSFENKFYYSLDDGLTWANYIDPIPFSKGTILCLKGDYPEGLSNSSRTVRFALSGKVKASGNIMSLIDNGACNTLTIPCFYCFRELFRDCTSLITPPELPATTLNVYCYYNIFRGCTNLTTAPTLPATTLARGCYLCMFYDCTSLTTAPELPATTLTTQCYDNMFSGCTSLVYPPALPATTLAEMCYSNMFSGCSSLVYPPKLSATTLAETCYQSMFWNCKNLITAPELPATTLAESCYYSMFYGCTSLIKAPVLTANILAKNCYINMFNGCSNLKYIKCLAGNNINNNTTNWVSGVPSTGTFVKNLDANWPSGTSGIPSGWEVVDAK